MSDLQLALLAGGGVFILAVVAFNVWQERRARGRAEKAFGDRPRDTLFDKAARPPERHEPTLGEVPPQTDIVQATLPAATAQADALEAQPGPAAEISSRIDTVAVILADDPIMREQLEPLLDALRAHRTPVQVEGIVEEQWHPIASSPRQSWRELRVGLQLASRAGPVAEEEIERFNRAIAEFAASVSAVSQRESPGTAAARAREVDSFCAEADVEVAINVVGQFGASFPVSRVKSLALEHGMSETVSGGLVSFSGDGNAEFVVRRFDEGGSKVSPGNYSGITFALDVPHVVDPVAVLGDMAQVAESFATNLAGQLVDDKRRPLSDAGLASIRRSVEKMAAVMEAAGVPPGSALARRLFS